VSDNSDDPQVELYEGLVGDENWNSPVRIQTSSLLPRRKALHFTNSSSHTNNYWRSVTDPRDHDELV